MAQTVSTGFRSSVHSAHAGPGRPRRGRSASSVLRERAHLRAAIQREGPSVAPPAVAPEEPAVTKVETILEAQGGILLEVDRGRRYRVGEDGLLHFRVRNLTRKKGHLRLRLTVPRVELHREEASIRLQPGGVHDVRFAIHAETPGEKLVETLECPLRDRRPSAPPRPARSRRHLRGDAAANRIGEAGST